MEQPDNRAAVTIQSAILLVAGTCVPFMDRLLTGSSPSKPSEADICGDLSVRDLFRRG
jgi:hypothetical protein